MVDSFFVKIAVACVAAFLFVRHVISLIQRSRFAKARGCKPPARLPQTERIIGYKVFLAMAADMKARTMLPTSLRLHREMGNTFSLVLLSQPAIATIEPENVKALLATQFHDFGIGKRHRGLGALLGHGIFTSDGTHWERSRALVRPSFARVHVADLETLESHIQHLIAKMPRDGSTIDLQPLFYQLTLDSATEFLMGESVDILRSPPGSEQQLFGEAFDFAQKELNLRLRLGPFVWFYRNRKFDTACVRVHNFIDKFVAKALEFRRQSQASGKTNVEDEKQKGKYIFMNELALATDDPIQIRSEILNILLAGRDTTAGLLSNTFHVLARRPDVWAKVKHEVDQLEGKRPDYETLRSMRYLKHVLNESLRLYPSVPQNIRYANKDTTLPVGGGPDGSAPIFVAKGQIIAYNLYSMHRRKDIYGEDADEYKPERWENLRVGWGYLPFNGGPRICVGQQFALTEAGYTLVRMVQEFERIESRDSKPWLENLHLTLGSGNGVHTSLFPRS
ncbi:hypothetical protein VC83_08941 [Pseudogymnoascus destructans]|uniref:Cytochrome P450 alkane hydroxylase n=2 Tax=Pseudogymnoascus destructans TaxID=655981 RepID=L8FNT2_PSED2|nr:uncharacterized protein VC83_08941 [Pseudogymnoascus destructans]ELR02562.1 hypothetical protein GMDG_01087 [Pseudogymnoascus destructans 20631-21]OAF54700.1 hypothetical protein VC83_08941 [Pseudogymnoascus destructans]